MGKLSNLYRNVWLKRFLLGGVGVLGAFSRFSDHTAEKPTHSTALQTWISDVQRKEKRDGYSIAALSEQPSIWKILAAHRSHRSHASHYSSRSGHRSHYSHYSSYNATPKDTPKAVEEKKVESRKVEKKKVEKKKEDVKPIIVETKNGTVKLVVSQTKLFLKDSTIVELIGVKANTFSETDFSDSKEVEAAAKAAKKSLTMWVKGKPVRYIFLEGNKAYVFVFLNELECRCVNLELIREGLLRADSDTSIYAHHVLLKAQKEAQDKGIGIWNKKSDRRK